MAKFRLVVKKGKKRVATHELDDYDEADLTAIRIVCADDTNETSVVLSENDNEKATYRCVHYKESWPLSNVVVS